MTEPYEIPTSEVGSLPDFLQKVEECCTGKRNVLLRGHADAAWKLEPKIARIRMRPGFSTATAEAEMLAEFKRRAASLAPRHMSSDWDWLALAQHHGLPTRLLDWSTNALVALWFAIECPPRGQDAAAIWIFMGEPDDYANEHKHKNPLTITRTLIFRPRHHAPRIVGQSGWFTAHKRVESSKSFIPLERNKTYKNQFIKLIIPAGRFAILREDLNRCGVNPASLFGDLDGLAKQIAWEFSPPSDEAIIIDDMMRDFPEMYGMHR